MGMRAPKVLGRDPVDMCSCTGSVSSKKDVCLKQSFGSSFDIRAERVCSGLPKVEFQEGESNRTFYDPCAQCSEQNNGMLGGRAPTEFPGERDVDLRRLGMDTLGHPRHLHRQLGALLSQRT